MSSSDSARLRLPWISGSPTSPALPRPPANQPTLAEAEQLLRQHAAALANAQRASTTELTSSIAQQISTRPVPTTDRRQILHCLLAFAIGSTGLIAVGMLIGAAHPYIDGVQPSLWLLLLSVVTALAPGWLSPFQRVFGRRHAAADRNERITLRLLGAVGIIVVTVLLQVLS